MQNQALKAGFIVTCIRANSVEFMKGICSKEIYKRSFVLGRFYAHQARLKGSLVTKIFGPQEKHNS